MPQPQSASAGMSETFYFSKAGIAIPTCVGIISMISSLTIMYLIIKSKTNSSYHRIIFGLSFFDVLASAAIALTTIPMPKDVVYPFAAPSYGTIKTCEVQGFIYIAGSAMTLMFSGILNIYYVCVLRYRMREYVFATRVEPFLYLLSIFGIILPVCLFLQRDIINPTTKDSHCSLSTYPLECDEYNNTECRGTLEDMSKFYVLYIITMGLGLGTLFLSMFLIIITFYKKERILKRSNRTMDYELESTQNTRRMLMKQASMYVGAFLLVWIFTFVSFLGGAEVQIYAVEVARNILQPSQGFFNLLIFVYHKVFHLQRIASDAELTFFEGLKMVLTNPSSIRDVLIVSSVEMLYFDDVKSKRLPPSNFISESYSEGILSSPPLRSRTNSLSSPKNQGSSKSISSSPLRKGEFVPKSMDISTGISEINPSSPHQSSELLRHSIEKFQEKNHISDHQSLIDFFPKSTGEFQDRDYDEENA